MKTIKLRTSTDEWNNVAYYRTFEIWDEEPTKDNVGDSDTDVIKICKISLDCEERNASDYDCYEVTYRMKYWDDDEDDDVLYVAVPVEPTSIRQELLENGENLSWCKPYVGMIDGKEIGFNIADGDIGCMMIDGEEHDEDDAAEIWDLYNAEPERFEIREAGCRECPWFDVCDALDD